MRDPNLLPAALVAGLALAAAGAASAGPPYATDDPAPTDRGHWEIYGFTGGQHGAGASSGASGLDLNYGGAKDLQLTAVIPAEFQSSGRPRWQAGDVELAAKYRLLHQDGPAGIDLAVFPRVFLPTAADRHGDRRASLLLPLWAGRDLGAWSVFGGGGYTFNPAGRDFWQGGLAVTHAFGERLDIGLEGFRQGADIAGAKPISRLGLGAAYRLTEHYSLLSAVSPTVENRREAGRYGFYVALKADY